MKTHGLREKLTKLEPIGLWVELENPWRRIPLDFKDYRSLEEQVKRHCDNVGHTKIESKRTCPYCGADPEWVDDSGPCCCDELVEAFESATKEPTS